MSCLNSDIDEEEEEEEVKMEIEEHTHLDDPIYHEEVSHFKIF